MAIAIVANLAANPNPTALPKRVEFTQTLATNRPPEAIRVVYSLAPAHDVWFQDSDGQLKKEIDRKETVATSQQVCVDRLTLVRGAGTGPQLTVEVSQTLVDAQGEPIADLVVLQLEA